MIIGRVPASDLPPLIFTLSGRCIRCFRCMPPVELDMPRGPTASANDADSSAWIPVRVAISGSDNIDLSAPTNCLPRGVEVYSVEPITAPASSAIRPAAVP